MLVNFIFLYNTLINNKIKPKIVLSLNPLITNVDGSIKIDVKSNYNSDILFEFDENILQQVNKHYFKAKKIGTTIVKAFQNETIFNKKGESESILISIKDNTLNKNNDNIKYEFSQKIFGNEKCNCDSLLNKECGCKELPIIFNPELNENYEITIGEEINFEIIAPIINNIVVEISNNNIEYSYINKNKHIICKFKAVSKGNSLLKIYCNGDYEYKYYIKKIYIKILPKNFEFSLIINENLFNKEYIIFERTTKIYHEENNIIYLDIDEILNIDYISILKINCEIDNDNILYKEDNNLKFLIPKKYGISKIKFFNDDTNEYDKVEKNYIIQISKKIYPYAIKGYPQFSYKSTEQKIILFGVSYSIKKNKAMFIYDLNDFALVFIKKLQHMYNKILDYEIIEDYYYKKDNCIKISNNKFKMIKCGKIKMKIKFDLDFKIYKKEDLIIIINCESVFNINPKSTNVNTVNQNTYDLFDYEEDEELNVAEEISL